VALEDLREQLRLAYDPQYRRFHELMAKRVKRILMVSNRYESFSLSRDASVTHEIYGTSQLLHLSNLPQITSAVSGAEAEGILGAEQFDLVLASANLPDVDISEFARRVKASHPGIPVVMLVFDGRWLALAYGGAAPEGVDGIFAWRGSANVLLSIIKLAEDRANVDRDIQIASIGTVIVIEDSVEHYSFLLPLLYTTLMARTFSLVPDGINENDRQLRTRVRPKVLLATDFGEAGALFRKYESSVVGIISDLRTHRDDLHDANAGERFLRDVVARSPGTPILLQSSEPRARELAAELGARYLDKRSPALADGLERFILEDVGFGDFVFRDRDGREIARCANLWEMEKVLPSIPDGSMVYHADRNDLSHWLRTRGETVLAAVLRPLAVRDFPSPASLRDRVVAAVSIARQEKHRGAIADFRGPEFDPSYPFLVIGRGSLGGKGRGLAFMFHLLSRELREDSIAGVRVRIPRTLVIATDEFDHFMRDNHMDLESMGGMDDGGVRERFLAGALGESLRRDLREYVGLVRVPLAVRSSSLLEDSHYRPSAGLYATFMLPNNHPDAAVRQVELERAIRLVYASAHLDSPRRFHAALGMNPGDEKMAVVIQEIAGAGHGDLFYPTFAGVAQSFNYYPISRMKPEDGVATVALGLGKQVVEGGEAVRFCPRHPQILPQFGSPAAVLDASQRSFYALDLSRPTVDLAEGTGATLARLPLDRAEADGTLDLVGGVVSSVDDRVYDGVNRPGARVVTFGRILTGRVFPLCEVLDRLLGICRESLGFASEMEFAVTLDAAGSGELAFLQVRPLVARRERFDLALETVSSDRILCMSRRVMGNGRIEGVRDLVYVDPSRFDRSASVEAAAAVSALNDRLRSERRPYLLIGPGRWGSLDPWIGIPITWHQISGARAIVEVPLRDLPMDPSQGTHFFHNMTSAGIGYFSLAEVDETSFVRWDLLDALPGEWTTPWMRHLTLEEPLQVRMDGHTGRGLVSLGG
jgi:CheY-like chemotaxis protein